MYFILTFQVVDAELERLGVLDELTSASLARLEGIPVDIRPCYPLAGETCGNMDILDFIL